MIKITSLTILSASLPRSPMGGATGGDRQVPGDATGVLLGSSGRAQAITCGSREAR